MKILLADVIHEAIETFLYDGVSRGQCWHSCDAVYKALAIAIGRKGKRFCKANTIWEELSAEMGCDSNSLIEFKEFSENQEKIQQARALWLTFAERYARDKRICI